MLSAAVMLPLFSLMFLAVVISVKAVEDAEGSGKYYGIPVGQFSTLQHGVRGSVYVVDSKRLRIRDLYYDGQGPAAYFWIGQKGLASALPNKEGLKLPNEKGSTKPLEAYSNADIVLTLPKKIATDDIAWLSIWCVQFSVDFGHVVLPATIAVPEPLSIGELLNPFQGLSTNDVVIRDVNTIAVLNLTYDGIQKEAYFVVGTNADTADKYIKLASDGQREPAPLEATTGLNLVFTIGQPDNTPPVTVGNYQFFGVHSYSSGKTLSRVSIPLRFNVPPYLKSEGDSSNSSRPAAATASASSSSSSASASAGTGSSHSDPDTKGTGPKSKPASAAVARQANATVGTVAARSSGDRGAVASHNTTGGQDSSTGRVGGSSGASGSANADGIASSSASSRRGNRGSGNSTNSDSSAPSSASSGSATRSTNGRGGASGTAGAPRTNNSTDNQSSTRS